MKRESKIKKKTYSGGRLTIAVSIYTLRNNFQIKKKKVIVALRTATR